jgi:poly(U)-specific endoribonuclease
MGAIISCLQNAADAVDDAQQQKPPQQQTQQQTQQQPSDKGEDFSKLNLKSMSVSDAMQKCWTIDANRLKPDVDYVLNVQKGKKPWWPEDKAEDPLFTKINSNVWQKPTYATFVALLDNYQSNTGVAETLGTKQRGEIDSFLNAIMSTKPMQFCHAYCHAHQTENVPSDVAGFKKVRSAIQRCNGACAIAGAHV